MYLVSLFIRIKKKKKKRRYGSVVAKQIDKIEMKEGEREREKQLKRNGTIKQLNKHLIRNLFPLGSLSRMYIYIYMCVCVKKTRD